MAKVNGPFMSLEASGTFGGVLTAAKWKGRQYLRLRVIPKNPQSAQQTGVRASMAGLVALWQGNVASLTTAFTAIATQRSISAFNAFTGFNQKRLSQGLFAANGAAPTEAAPAANATGLTASVDGKYVTVTWTDSVSADAWVNYLYRKLGSDPTGTRGELIAVVPNGIQQWVDGPLAAGTWHYVIAAGSEHGGAHAVSTAETAIVA